MTLSMTILFTAQPQGSKKAFVIKGRAVLVESSKSLKQNRADLSTLITAEAYREKWVRAERGVAVKVSVEFETVKPASVKRSLPAVRPDVDKLGRFVLDAITDAENVYVDDSQVVDLTLRKRYGDVNLIRIEVEVIE
jgi:Holliday junction resolvase RusA-like endonuclease